MREFDISLYRVSDLVSASFDDYPINSVDFTLHLKPDVVLTKKVVKSASGRPTVAEYRYQDELICKITFIFEVDPSTALVSRRKEVLNYLKKDGGLSPDVLLKDKTFNFSDPSDLEVAMREREDGRHSVLSQLKGMTIGVIQAYNPQMSSMDVVNLVRDFWDDTATERDDFIELGDNSFRDFIVAIDLSNTPYSWLAYQIQPNVTIKDYYVQSLSF